MIYIDERKKAFFLEGENFTYAIDVSDGYLRHAYWGKKIERDDIDQLLFDHPAGYVVAIEASASGRGSLETLPQEISFFGLGDYRTSCFKATGEDGGKVFDLKYDSFELLTEKPSYSDLPMLKGGETLVVRLLDAAKRLELKLYYTVYEECGCLTRHAEITPLGGTVFLERALGFCVDLPDCGYDCITLYGKHSCEAQIDRQALGHGEFSVSSCMGISSHVHNPFMALAEKHATENAGDVYGFGLVYSGNFFLSAQTGEFGTIRVCGGINPLDFRYRLREKESFVTPEVLMTYSECGLGGMSRNFHRAIDRYILKRGVPPIVANSWEATFFDFDTKKLFGFIDGLKELNIDTFVLDDGWFGRRDSDRTSLGDWKVNTKKLVGGLEPVINKCKENGLKFGIWIEPEMISEESELYTLHPDWAVKSKFLKPRTSRNQLVLDLTRKEVLDYLKSTFYALLKNHDISYVKWDMNRPLTEFYSAGLEKENQGEFAHRYVKAVYELADYLTRSFPDIYFEGCAGGGGRFDIAMLKYFSSVWASDSCDAEERCRIQYGYSYLYPLKTVSSHVGASPAHQTSRSIPLESRCNVSAFGAFGYELRLDVLPQEEREFIADCNLFAKQLRSVLAEGELFRTENPFESKFTGFIVMNRQKTKGYGLFYQSKTSYGDGIKMIRLRGLDPKKKYSVPKFGVCAYGSTLMNMGIQHKTTNTDYQSVLYEINEAEND